MLYNEINDAIYPQPDDNEERPVYICDKCGLGIYEGDNYYETENGKLCEDCTHDCSIGELMDWLGFDKRMVLLKRRAED